MSHVTSTRWSPTPEQLMILEEMYRTGARTPSASQIQKITAYLSRYGRIEGKNVFYWFQNHKARERQKLRRRLSRYHQIFYSGMYSFSPVLPHYQFQCLQEVPLPPLPDHYCIRSHFPDQQDSTQGLNLLCKLETAAGYEELSTTAKNSGYGYEHMVMMDVGSGISPSCRPLETLDFFPTKSTGLKDECITAKSSSIAPTNLTDINISTSNSTFSFFMSL